MRAGLLSSATVFVLGARGSGLELRDAPGGGVPVNIDVPTIDNMSPNVGDTINASTGTWSGSPLSYAYQWSNNGGPIGGATSSSYTTGAPDVGQSLSVTVVAHNGAGDSLPAQSASTSGVNATPANTSPPTIDNMGPTNGVTLNASPGAWTCNPTGYSYQWYANGSAVGTGPSFLVDPDGGNMGQTIHVGVVASNAIASSSEAESAETQPVA